MALSTDLIKALYAGAYGAYNEIRDLEYDEFPSFNSLSRIQQADVEVTIQAACDTLIVDIYGGGFYNDTHLHKYTTEALTPFFDTLVDKS